MKTCVYTQTLPDLLGNGAVFSSGETTGKVNKDKIKIKKLYIYDLLRRHPAEMYRGQKEFSIAFAC